MYETEDYRKANDSSIQMLTVEFIWLVYKSRNDNIKKNPTYLFNLQSQVVIDHFIGELF